MLLKDIGLLYRMSLNLGLSFVPHNWIQVLHPYRNITEGMLYSACCIWLGGTWFWLASLLMMSTLIIWLRCYVQDFFAVTLLILLGSQNWKLCKYFSSVSVSLWHNTDYHEKNWVFSFCFVFFLERKADRLASKTAFLLFM